MKINIYGVGRSGTKAIQLWLAYLIAGENQDIWVNYEPFHYQKRSLEPTNLGQIIHRHTSLFLESESYPLCFKEFCQNLAGNDLVITKFIRANGRIQVINNIMQIDLSFLVIRDIYKVLQSILLQPWDFAEDKYEWDRLCNFSEDKYPILNDIAIDWQKTNNRVIKNAIYWFSMNMYALENIDGKTILIDFDDLKKTIKILTDLGLKRAKCIDISHSAFTGNNIHSNSFLQDKKDIQKSHGQPKGKLYPRALMKLLNFSDMNLSDNLTNFLYSLALSNPKTKNESLGSLCSFKENFLDLDQYKSQKSFKEPRAIIQENHFLNTLASQVKEKMKAVDAEYRTLGKIKA